MSNGTQEAKVSTASALDQILSRVLDNNSKLRDILTNVEAFLVRALGEGRTEDTGADVPQPSGKLPGIDFALNVQDHLIGDLHDAVNALERIG